MSVIEGMSQIKASIFFLTASMILRKMDPRVMNAMT